MSASTEVVSRVAAAAATKPNQQKKKRGAGRALPTKSNKKQKQIEMSSTATNVSKPNQQQKKSQKDKKKLLIYRKVTVVVDSQRLESVIEGVPKMKKIKFTSSGTWHMVRLLLPTQSRTSVVFMGVPRDRAALVELTFAEILQLLRDDKLPLTRPSGVTKGDLVDRLSAGPPAYEKYTLAELKYKCYGIRSSVKGDESTLIARLKDHDNGTKPSSIKVMNSDDDQKKRIISRIAVVAAFVEDMHAKDTEGMIPKQKSRYIYPLKQVKQPVVDANDNTVGAWINVWKRGRSCANHSKMMDEFECNLLNEKFQFFSLPNATHESAINDCTFPETVELYNALVAEPRNKDKSWDGVEEDDVVDKKSGINLSDWAMLQRKLYKDDLLSAEQIDCLNRIGFELKLYKPKGGKSYYELHSEHIKMWRLIQKYKDNMGSDFNGHISACTGEETKLGKFIMNQREAFNNGKNMMFRIDILKFLRLEIMADATSFGPANIQTDDRLMKGMVRNSNAERRRNQEVPTNHDDRLFKTTGDVTTKRSTKRSTTSNSNRYAATASSSAMMEEIEAQGGAADALGETEVAPEDDPIVNGMVDQALANIMASLPDLPPVGRDDEPTQVESSTYASQLETLNATDIFVSQVGSTPTKMNTASV